MKKYLHINQSLEEILININLDFKDMNFGDKYATQLIICCKSNIGSNIITVKFFNIDFLFNEIIELNLILNNIN